jgi:hypothetical protein
MDLIVTATAMITYHSTAWFLALQALITLASLLFLFNQSTGSIGYIWLLLALVTWLSTILRDTWLIKYHRRDADFTSIDTRWAFSRGLSLIAVVLRTATLIAFFEWLGLDQVAQGRGGGFIITLVVIENVHALFVVEFGRALTVWRRREADFLAAYMDTQKASIQEQTTIGAPSTLHGIRDQILNWATPRRFFATGIKMPVLETVHNGDGGQIELGQDEDTL